MTIYTPKTQVKKALKAAAVVKIEVLIDPAAEGSLFLARELSALNATLQDGGVCIVEATERQVYAITEKYSLAVMKVDVL